MSKFLAKFFIFEFQNFRCKIRFFNIWIPNAAFQWKLTRARWNLLFRNFSTHGLSCPNFEVLRRIQFVHSQELTVREILGLPAYGLISTKSSYSLFDGAKITIMVVCSWNKAKNKILDNFSALENQNLQRENYLEFCQTSHIPRTDQYNRYFDHI